MMEEQVRFNDRGEEVRRIQEALIAKGHALTFYGVDGHLGDETWAALQSFARENYLRWDPPVIPRVLRALRVEERPAEVPEIPNVRIYDLRKDQENPPPKPGKFKVSGGQVLARRHSSITGITVHQTAVPYGVADYQVKAAGGDRELALARRSLDVACHMMAFREGFVAWPNPLEWYVHHGNGWNATDLGLEIDGRYPGVKDGSTWDGKKATPVTEDLVMAARAAVALLVSQGRAAGMPIQCIHAHRQSSSSRRDDPGEELWRSVVLDYAVPVLGLVTEPTRTLGSGQPVPVQWDPDGLGEY